jgi:TolB-like protein
VGFVFGRYFLDVDRRELRSGNALVTLAPQVFDLLLYLLRWRDRVVTKDDLLEAVWGGRIVSESALTTRISAARRAIGDSGGRQELIRTLPRKGFRFIGFVREAEKLKAPVSVRARAASDKGAQSPRAFQARPAPRLSIVVLPFQNLSNDPDQEYFADGITDDLTSDLSRISGSCVIARTTAFTYKGKPVDVKQIGRELAVHYVLEGSVRRTGDQVRVNAQLIDAVSGAHLWADRFDTNLANLAKTQSEITGRLAWTLNMELLSDASRRI